jgi:hypothetical protein
MSHHSDLEAAAGQAAILKLWSHAVGVVTTCWYPVPVWKVTNMPKRRRIWEQASLGFGASTTSS